MAEFLMKMQQILMQLGRYKADVIVVYPMQRQQ